MNEVHTGMQEEDKYRALLKKKKKKISVQNYYAFEVVSMCEREKHTE